MMAPAWRGTLADGLSLLILWLSGIPFETEEHGGKAVTVVEVQR